MEDIASLRIQDALDFWGVKGCSVAVVLRDGADAPWKDAFIASGRRNRNGEGVDKDTRFFIASNSKLFCALVTAISLKAAGFEKGLQTRIQEAIPEYQLYDTEAGAAVTFAHALSHCTGLPRHDNYASNNVRSLEQMLEIVKALRPSLALGEANQYHNLHYDFLAVAVEKISGKDYGEYVAETILRPLGLDSTTVSPGETLSSPNHAEGFWQYHETNTSRGEAIYMPTGMTDKSCAIMGAGRMSSTATDMSRWMKVLLSEGKHPETGVQVLPPTLLRECMMGTVPFYEYVRDYPELGPGFYGLGLSEQTYHGHKLFEHIGSLCGTHSRLCVAPDRQLGIFVMTNSSPWGEMLHEEIKFDILERIFGTPRVDWRTRLLAEKEERLKEQDSRNAAALTKPTDALPPTITPDALAGHYVSPGFHRWVLESRHILDQPPAELHEMPGSPYMWGRVQPYLWHWSGHTYKMVWEFTFPPSVGKPPLMGCPIDIEVDVDQAGAVKGFGVKGIWGAGKGVPSPSGETIRERAEMYFTKS